MAKRFLATLLTDFGSRDPYPAAVKGAILRACPRAEIIDITHDVPAHDVLAAAFVLAESAPYFPPDTVHVVVVDPGVGTDRRILVGRFGEQTYLFPDNGVISFIADTQPMEELVVVRNPDLLPRSNVSTTFHGRDVFAPLAAHLLNGVDPRRFGPQPDTYRLLDLPKPRVTEDQIVGQVIYVDSFGNLVSNIRESLVREHWPDLEHIRGSVAGQDVGPIEGTYAFVDEGQTLLLFNSMGRVEVAVNQGRACDKLAAAFGTEIRLAAPLRPHPPRDAAAHRAPRTDEPASSPQHD